MRVVISILAGLCAASMTVAPPAYAQKGPVIVVPGKVGVPVIIDGMIVDGAVVYGDWGLARPGHGDLLIEGPVAYAAPWHARGYYPATGRMPRYGRYEVEPPARRRPRSTDFHRQWSIGSEFKEPVTEYPPYNPPPVILAPRDRRPVR